MPGYEYISATRDGQTDHSLFYFNLFGFGDLINEGLSRTFPTPIVVGAVLSVALAITFDLLFVLVERLLTPWARARTPRDEGQGDALADALARSTRDEELVALPRSGAPL